MSTRSNIAYEEDGVVKVAFFRQDGYLDHTGRMLFDHYNSFEKAKELVELGSYQSIKPEINDISLYSAITRPPDTYRSIRSYMHHVDAQEIEYIYMWEKKMWWIARSISINTWRAWHHEQNEQGYHQFVCYHSKFESLGSELAHWDYDNPTDEQGAYV
jgi:hypothetical protein